MPGLRLSNLAVPLLILCGIGASVLFYTISGVTFIDDAYITFRYAQNLSDGYGIVWNIGDAPTQGSTSMAFVLGIALGFRLNLHPLMMALFLNTIGFIISGLSVYYIGYLTLDRRPLLPFFMALAALLQLPVLILLTGGMETLFWTGLIYTAITLTIVYRRTGHPLAVPAFYVVSFLACLTRPESVLIVGLLMLVFMARAHRDQNYRPVLIATGMFVIAGVLYLIWLQSYFGTVLPNSFYVKVSDGTSLPGLVYVLLFVIHFITLFKVVALIGLILLFRRGIFPPREVWTLLVLPVFYTFTQPLIGEYFRFLIPTFMLFVALLCLGFGFLVRALMRIIREREAMSPSLKRGLAAVIGVVGVVIGFIGLNVWSPYPPPADFDRMRDDWILERNTPMMATAYALADVPDIRDVSIAYGDAGALPYYSRAYHIDPVGLNDTQIARKAQEDGPQWVIDFILAQNPDLIGFYTNRDGTIFNKGHGVVGTAYSDLYLADDFQAHYVPLAAVDNNWVYVYWFVHQESPHRDVLASAFAPVAAPDLPPIVP